MKINEIKLAELQRALDDNEGRYPYIGVGKHSIDTEMLRDLVKLAQGYEAEIEAAKKAGWEDGYEEAYFECECDGE